VTRILRVRLGWGIVDQLLSSASNTLIVFAIAPVSSVDEFGAYSLALAALTTVLAISRGLLGTAINLLSAHLEKLRQEAGYALSVSVVGGLAAGLLIAVTAALAHAPPATYFVALAAPFVLMQDIGRFFCIAAGLPRRAVSSDGVWACGSVALLIVTWFSPRMVDAVVLLGGWACVAVLAMLLVLWPQRLIPRISGLRRWWRNDLRDRVGFGASAVIAATGSFLVLSIAASIIGVAATAALLGASSIFGPFNIVISAMALAVVPELRRRGDVSSMAIWSLLRKIALPTSVLALAIGGIALLVPQGWGELILGDSWTVVRPVLPLTAMEYAALAWVSAASSGMMTQGRSITLVKLRLLTSGMSVALGSAVAIVAGSAVAVAGALVVAAVMAAVYGRLVLLRGSAHGTVV